MSKKVKAKVKKKNVSSDQNEKIEILSKLKLDIVGEKINIKDLERLITFFSRELLSNKKMLRNSKEHLKFLEREFKSVSGGKYV